MKVLVVGNGGREHALTRSLLQSPEIDRLWVAPGNGGTANLDRCDNVPVGADDVEGLCRVAQDLGVDLVVVGPEVPLALGLGDRLTALDIPVFGPHQAGAQLEASKTWAKDFMVEQGIPTARFASFNDRQAALAYVAQQPIPIVIKADGLAAGKGVTVAQTRDEAIAALEAAFGGQFGDAGSQVVIEDCLQGAEASILAFTDGKTIRPLVAAQDHKRIGEGDTGANTGGMGAYAPAPLITPDLMERIQREILEPTIAGLQARGIDYRGIVYAGLMISPQGDPNVIEFNCRFGDPETQVVLPLLETPLLGIIQACLDQRLGELPPFQWRSGVACTVVAAAPGYPGAYPKGSIITGIEAAEAQGVRVFQAGTTLDQSSHPSHVVTSGGRVLAVTGDGSTFDDAFRRTYQALQLIQFDGIYYRRDIGHQVRSPL